MKLLMMVPPNMGFEIEGSYGTQIVVAALMDGGDEIICVIDQNRHSYHIQKVVDRNAIFKYSDPNMVRIDDDEAWEAYHKFFHDAGLGIILDGMRLKETGSIKSK